MTKEILWLDVEATGSEPRSDRIVELALVQGPRRHAWRFNPTVPIPAEATDIHGISDSDVVDCRTFEDWAPRLLGILRGRPLGGYNIRRFDLPILLHEFDRCGMDLPLDGVAVVDVMQIFMKLHPRTLAHAVRKYLRKEIVSAHTAMADTEVLPDLLGAMLSIHEELPQTTEGLSELCDTVRPVRTLADDWFDRTGEGLVFRRGKHRGERLADIQRDHNDYLEWMLDEEGIAASVKRLIKEVA